MSALSYLSPKAEVRPSAIHGRGLFAREAIAKGEMVCVKGAHIFDRRRLVELQPDLGPAEIQITEDLFIGPARAEDREGGMIFSNHSCEPNIGVRGQIVFVAMRDVAAGEELTHDWAMTDDDLVYLAITRLLAPTPTSPPARRGPSSRRSQRPTPASPSTPRTACSR